MDVNYAQVLNAKHARQDMLNRVIIFVVQYASQIVGPAILSIIANNAVITILSITTH